MINVLDSSVYVACHAQHEKHFERASQLWDLIPHNLQFHVPEIFRLEVISAFARTTRNAEVVATHKAIVSDKKFVSYAIDTKFLDEAITVVEQGCVRSADAMYVALALRLDVPLITLDIKLKDQLARSQSVIFKNLEVIS